MLIVKYCVYMASEKLRSVPMSRYKAYKIRKHFKSELDIEIKVRKYMDVVFEKIYDTMDLLELGLM